MLICPQCEFENPNNNKYCQKCGKSLTHKNCYKCGSKVSLTDLQCHNCGADTGQVWKAIINKTLSLEASAHQTEINLEKLDQEEFVVEEISLTKESAADTIDNEEKESEEIIKLSELFEEKISTEKIIEPSKTLAISPSDIESVNPPLETITEVDNQTQDIEDSDNSKSTNVDILSQIPEVTTTENESSLNSTENISNISEKYLDSEERYQLLETIPINNQEQTIVVQVLDLYPLENTPIRAWLKNNSQKRFKQKTPEMEALIVPMIAQPYINLYSQIPQYLPEIHDSWRSPDQEILLVTDYSSWPKLVDFWKTEDISQQQILSWLQQITELWVVLAPCNSCQSIVEYDNLLVNQAENNLIKLQRLYLEPDEEKNDINNLMLFWQGLFEKSQRTHFSWITDLFQGWQNGEIQTIEKLRSYLMNTQNSLQPQPISKSSPTTLQIDDSASKVVDNIETQDTQLLPTQLISLESSGKTNVGTQRDHNEDAFGIQTQIESQQTTTEKIIQAKGIYILCDGMGGHASGEIASQLGVDTIKQYFNTEGNWFVDMPSEETIRTAILKANEVIYDINQQEIRSGSSRMGTTLVMAMIYDTKLAVAHVGDSRLYRFSRKGGLEQITLDHEVGQREINRGIEAEIAYGRPDAYQLTQALGPRNENFVRPDIQFLNLDEDSLLILASDGLTDNQLLENNWQTHLEPLLDKKADLELGVNKLIDLANQYNGHDNITAIAIRALVKQQQD
ncbi:serine/threonine phosphatase [Okeania sp.]|uniref:serine/threonine phosphatase n=1 Tax=Okeania sp. TaxID=3100323 RepID=UPI002B4B3D70|nr:serine/threonine phosphatase [Okeania sp.]MEB3341035.1 serine/threonine phosphatase [Okeania sp.]